MIQWIPTGVTQVTGGAGAASLVSLMNTAVTGKGDAALALNPNCVMLVPEGTCRFTLDGSTPTAAIGLQGAATTTANNTLIYEAQLDKVIIIGAVKINIMVGHKTIG